MVCCRLAWFGPYVEELAPCYASRAFAISNEHFDALSVRFI